MERTMPTAATRMHTALPLLIAPDTLQMQYWLFDCPTGRARYQRCHQYAQAAINDRAQHPTF